MDMALYDQNQSTGKMLFDNFKIPSTEALENCSWWNKSLNLANEAGV